MTIEGERAAAAIARVDAQRWKEEAERLRAALKTMSVNEGKLHARIAELETDLKELRFRMEGLEK